MMYFEHRSFKSLINLTLIDDIFTYLRTPLLPVNKLENYNSSMLSSGTLSSQKSHLCLCRFYPHVAKKNATIFPTQSLCGGKNRM